jgi:Peptidase family M1 domain
MGRMTRFLSLPLFLLALLCPPGLAPLLHAQDANSVWQAVSQPAFDPSHTATVENLVLTRDRIRLTLTDGTIQFAKPAAGVVFAAVFSGHGRVQIDPPNALEAQQLRRFSGQDRLDLEFTEATFSFTDDTFAEVARQVHWIPAQATFAPQYQERQQALESSGAALRARLLEGVLSANRQQTALFAVEHNTEKGWVLVNDDALVPEEVEVGQWKDVGGREFFDTWMSFPAGGISSSEAYRDTLAKETFQVLGYKIDATVTQKAEFSATTEAQLIVRYAGARVLLFHLSSYARVDSVRDASGASLPFFQAPEPTSGKSYGSYLAVALPSASQAGERETLTFHYAARHLIRKVGTDSFFCPSGGWYPAGSDDFALTENFDLTFHFPKNYELVATGSQTSEMTEGPWKVSTWKSDIPLHVAGFAYGDYKVVGQSAGDTEVEVYANRNPDDFMQAVLLAFPGAPLGTLEPSGMAKTMATEMGNMVRLDEEFFGPYPYKHLAMTNIPYSYGQGWPGLVYLSAISFMDPAQRGAFGIGPHASVLLTDYFRAHEVSHQWWGHKVGWKSYHDQWLSEGFAQFSGNLYTQFRENMKTYLQRVRDDRDALLRKDQHGHVFESVGPIWMGHRIEGSDVWPANAYQTVVYSKGGLVLNTLRWMLLDPHSQKPDERFIQMMHDYTETYQGKAASTEDFKAIAEKYMTPLMDLDGNHRLDWFFNEYVYATGIPTYRMKYQVESAGQGKWMVSCEVDRTGVPDNWKDILPLYIHYNGHDMRLGWMRATANTSRLHFTLPVKPDRLSLNDNEDILAIFK